ncbi:hypothetical protein [Mycobacterium sp. NPDC050853]|uniref:hypothetical protein n=1 Tax=Mycobacterium sp. NPDC050853 TaxID=3155160 RepID=UPI0033DC4AA0
MADVTVASALITGIPAMLTAIVGVGGVLLTQKRADARQERIATSNREFERETKLVERRREAGADLLIAVWALASRSIDLVPEGAGFKDLTPEEIAPVHRAISMVRMVCDEPGRKAADAVFESLIAHVGVFTQESWEAIGTAEDALVAAINVEASEG